MSDDLGTVNLRRGERGREIEILRQHYRRHRELLEKLSADAPTEHLAGEYHRIAQSIDASLLKLDELEGRGQSTAAAPAAAAAARVARPAVPPPVTPDTQPAMRPLQPHPALRHLDDEVVDEESQYEGEERSRGSRTALIVVASLLALALVAWLVWRASSDREDVPLPITETETVTPAEPDTGTIEPVAPPPAGVSVTPDAQNYGLIRKGTRATRQFEIANPSDRPLTVQVSRSNCRCLFYEYVDTIAPKSKEALTVTVDANRAKAGELRETIKVSSKADPAKSASFEVVANIQ